MQRASAILSSVAYLALYYFFYIISQTAFFFEEKNIIGLKMCFDFFWVFFWSIFHSKKNWAR